MITYTLKLENRQLTFFFGPPNGEQTQLKFSNGNAILAYDSVFVALRRALDALAKHTGFANNNGTTPDPELGAALNKEELQIYLVGEAREIAVAKFYVKGELDAARGVHIEAITGVEPIYE